MNMNKPVRTASLSLSDLIGPLSAASFGGYAIGITLVVLLWHLM
jgi:hypothetical protein